MSKKDQPLLVIVTGPPASGKTTVAKHIANQLNLPLVTKDGIKDSLFETLGWSNREWSKKLSNASFEIMFYFADVMLAGGRALVMEGNFSRKSHTKKVRDLQKEYGAILVQVFCRAKDGVTFQRFQHRFDTGGRHPGHVDNLMSFETFRESYLTGNCDPLDVSGKVFEIDTTNLAKVDYKGLMQTIRAFSLGKLSITRK